MGEEPGAVCHCKGSTAMTRTRLRLAAIVIFCPVLCPLAFIAGAAMGVALAISEILFQPTESTK